MDSSDHRPDDQAAFWNTRYAKAEYCFGTAANPFVVEIADRIPPGPVLCLGEGEGRNAVWLAEQGFQVTAVDVAEAGLAKAEALAAERGVALTTIHADLADYIIEVGAWAGIVQVF
ncbi:MAG: methyltransferase domain-containing protein, partial [Planctomycetota bacterium]